MTKKRAPRTSVQVGVSALARETGQSPSAVSQKLRQGQTPDDIRAAAARKQGRTPGKAGRKPVPSEYDRVIASRTRYDDLEDAKLRRAKALAERQELENLLRKGELIPLAHARTWITKLLVEGRDTLMQGPTELQDVLAAEDDPLKIAAVLRGWLERAMAKFESIRTHFESDAEAERVA